jgi:signal transduction histidine kinase
VGGILVASEDVTARVQAQRALRESEERLKLHAANLEAMITERTAKLRKTIGELEAFSYSLSHDMRAPLRAIQSYSQVALKLAGENASPFLNKVIVAAGRLDRMIQEVLSYTRLSRQEIRIERVEVERLVDEIISERPELQPPNAEITLERPLLPMRGHGASLTQCLTNLLGNAVKFVPRGVTPQVRVHSERAGHAVRLWIEDNGIGITPEAQRNLFEMFYRANRDSDYEGTGLGLAIVRKAVERMGGQVGVESQLGCGSRFWVELPSAERDLLANKTYETDSHSAGRR